MKSSIQPTARLTVLVVDNDEASGEIMATFLARWGFDVCLCRNGPDALVAARAHSPNIALLDLAMPLMDGYEVARRLRQQPEFEDSLLFALTADDDPAAIEKSLEVGIDLHITKPISSTALHELLDQARLSRAAALSRAAELVAEFKALISIVTERD